MHEVWGGHAGEDKCLDLHRLLNTPRARLLDFLARRHACYGRSVMRWLLFLYPWLELWSLIELGGQTAPLVSLGWVLATVMLGGAMIRWAGGNSLQRLAQASAGGTLPQQLLMTDVAVILSGLLLAIPGLVSDLLAVFVLITPFRRLAGALWAPHVRASTFHAGSPGGREDIIEGEFSVSGATDHLEHLSDREPPENLK